MKRESLWCVIAITFLALINSCATTALTSVWEDRTYRGGPLRKVLVIGIFQKEEAESFFDDEFASQLKAKGVDAVSGYSVLPEDSILDKEAMALKIKELGVDSVLVTRLVDVRDAGRYETYPTRVDAQFFDYYVMCCQTTVSPGYNVLLETKIFEAKNDKTIWSALSESSFDRSLENTLKSFIPAIMKDLRDKKLIQ